MLTPGDLPAELADGHRDEQRAPSWQPGAMDSVHTDDAATQSWDVCGELNLGVARTAATLSDERCGALLTVSSAFARAYLDGADLRRLNIAAKALGACWQRAHRGDLARPGDASDSARLIAAATVRMRSHVTAALRTAADRPAAPEAQPAGGDAVHVLAGSGSGTFALFAQLYGHRIDIVSTLAYAGTGVGGSAMYAHAWKPPNSAAAAVVTAPRQTEATSASWDGVATWLSDLLPGSKVLLFGMPVVPARVLAHAPGLVLNAHNGALPGLRGLDALAWATAIGTPPTATAHEVVAEVDAGLPLAAIEVALHPLPTVADRLKRAQCAALVAALPSRSGNAAHPVGAVTTRGRYYGRMHPHLRRVLDSVVAEHLGTTNSGRGTG